MTDRPIKTKIVTPFNCPEEIQINGWYAGKRSYLRIATKETDKCIGLLYGPKLYRFCKAIVNHFESDDT